MIPLSEPVLGELEADYVRQCMESGWISSAGPFVSGLEQAASDLLGLGHSVATSSGTAALHLALLVAGVRPGEEVLVSDLTFIAPVNAIKYVGAVPVLFDCDPDTWQMDPSLVRKFLEADCLHEGDTTVNRQTGRKVAALMPVHLLGHPVDMDPLLELSKRFCLPIIEDASESLGARYRGKMVGCHGLISCFSFNGNKIVTGGGGGLLATENEEMARKARYLSTQAKDDPTFYIHEEIGYNYRLTNLQAAVVLAQLRRLPEFIESKRKIAATYNELLAPNPNLELPRQQSWADPTWWLYTVLLRQPADGEQRELIDFLMAKGIQARPLWHPIHCNRPYRDCQFVGHPECQSLRLAASSVSLPSSANLTTQQQHHVCQQLDAFWRSV